MRRHLAKAAAAAALLTGLGGPALAQVGAPPASSPSEAAPALPELIVQARRVDEPQQAVPVAVTTLTTDRLRQDTVTEVRDVQRSVPSFRVEPSSLGGDAAPTFAVRGLSETLLTDPSVVSYFDEVVTDPRNFAYSMYDLQSVQVLKGPQGTLFGRNSTGGAALFQPVRPGPDLGGFLDFRYGNLDDREFTGAINLPITPELQLRLAGELERRDGSLKSDSGGFGLDNRDHESVRAELMWRPSETFDNYLQGTLYRVRQTNNLPILTNVAACPFSPPYDPSTLPLQLAEAPECAFEQPLNQYLGTADLNAYLAQQQAIGRNHTINDYKAPLDVDYNSLTDIAQLHFGGITLKNIAHMDYSKSHVGFDFDGTPLALLGQDDRQSNHFYSDEMQLFGRTAHDRLQWLLGGYYSQSRQNEYGVFHQIDIQLDPSSPLYPYVEPLLATRNPLDVTDHVPQTSKALFGQATYDFSDWVKGLSFTAGYRYTWDDRSFSDQRLQGSPVQYCGLGTVDPSTGEFSFFPGVDPATCTRSLSASFHDDGYDFSLNWRPTDKLLLYVTARKGYKAGGFNFTASQEQFVSYQPEEFRDWEAGLKGDWNVAGVPVRTNLAVFRGKFDNIQTQETVFDAATLNLESLVVNQDPLTGTPNKATITGGEAEVTVVPTPGLTLSGFYGYTSGSYDTFIDSTSGSPVSLAGQDISGIARHTAGFAVTYAPHLPEAFGAPVLSANYYYRSRLATNQTDSLIITSQPVHDLDLRIDWRNVGRRGLDVAIYGVNVTNDRTTTLGFDLTQVIGIASQQCSEPATYGVEVRYHFGAG